MAQTPRRRSRRTSRTLKRPAPVQKSQGRPPIVWGSVTGIGPDKMPPPCKFFPKGCVLPVGLILQFDGPIEGGNNFGCEQLSRPTLLIYAQDPDFACCWFSRAIDLGDESGNPAFWMLQKTAKDTWSLCLRRVSGELAAYALKSKSNGFPIKLKKGKTAKIFKWPATITIYPQG